MTKEEAQKAFDDINITYRKKNMAFNGGMNGTHFVTIENIKIINVIRNEEEEINEYDVLIVVNSMEPRKSLLNYSDFKKTIRLTDNGQTRKKDKTSDNIRFMK